MSERIAIVPLSTKFLYVCVKTVSRLRELLPNVKDFFKFLDADVQKDGITFDHERFNDEMGETFHILSAIRDFVMDYPKPIIKHPDVKVNKSFNELKMMLDLTDFAGIYTHMYKYYESIEPLFKIVSTGMSTAMEEIIKSIDYLIDHIDSDITTFNERLINIYQLCEDMHTHAHLIHVISYIYGHTFENVKEYSRTISNVYITMINFAAITNYLITSSPTLKYRLYVPINVNSMNVNEMLIDPSIVDKIYDVWSAMDINDIDDLSVAYILHPDKYEKCRRQIRIYADDVNEHPIDDVLDNDVDGDLRYYDALHCRIFNECGIHEDWFDE